MMIEERIEKLEMENQALKDRIAALENNQTPQYVTIGELAEIMQCSRQNIYQKIRTGNILATRKLWNLFRDSTRLRRPLLYPLSYRCILELFPGEGGEHPGT